MTANARGWMAGLFWKAVEATSDIHRALHTFAMLTEVAATEHTSNISLARFSVALRLGPLSWFVDVDAPSRANTTGTQNVSLRDSERLSRTLRSLFSLASSRENDVHAAWIELISKR